MFLFCCALSSRDRAAVHLSCVCQFYLLHTANSGVISLVTAVAVYYGLQRHVLMNSSQHPPEWERAMSRNAVLAAVVGAVVVGGITAAMSRLQKSVVEERATAPCRCPGKRASGAPRGQEYCAQAGDKLPEASPVQSQASTTPGADARQEIEVDASRLMAIPSYRPGK